MVKSTYSPLRYHPVSCASTCHLRAGKFRIFAKMGTSHASSQIVACTHVPIPDIAPPGDRPRRLVRPIFCVFLSGSRTSKTYGAIWVVRSQGELKRPYALRPKAATQASNKRSGAFKERSGARWCSSRVVETLLIRTSRAPVSFENVFPTDGHGRSGVASNHPLERSKGA